MWLKSSMLSTNNSGDISSALFCIVTVKRYRKPIISNGSDAIFSKTIPNLANKPKDCAFVVLNLDVSPGSDFF